LVVSNDKGNEVSDTIIVAPITSKVKKVYSFEVIVSVAGKKGKAMMNQCRTVDKSRLGNTICHIDAETMDATNEALRIAFGLS
jgi:mRNA interferase MazF